MLSVLPDNDYLVINSFGSASSIQLQTCMALFQIVEGFDDNYLYVDGFFTIRTMITGLESFGSSHDDKMQSANHIYYGWCYHPPFFLG
jgi:hypothetical protein